MAEDDPYGLINAYSGLGPYLPQQAQTARQKFAQQLLLEGMSSTPVAHPLQALARTLQGGFGGYLAGQNDRELAAQQAGENALIGRAFGGGGQPAAAAPGPAVQPGPPVSPGSPYTQIGLENVPSGGLPPLNLANIQRSVAGTEIPLTRMAQMSAKVETGTDDLKQASLNISPDTGGSKSYGIFGFNSGYGGGAGKGSAAQFAASAPSLGLTATPGSAQFDAQWKNAAATQPEQLVAAQLDYYQKNILPTLTGGLASAGVPPGIANDPKTQAYFADRAVQYGPASTQQHNARISQAMQQSGGTTEGFLKAMSAADKANLQGDFRTYLSTRPQDMPGLNNRVSSRERLALGIEGGGTPVSAAVAGAPTQVAQAGPASAAPSVAQAPANTALPSPSNPIYRPRPELMLLATRGSTPAVQAAARAQIDREWKDAQKEYDFRPLPDGRTVAINKKDPNDTRVISAVDSASLIAFDAAKTAATTRAELTTKADVQKEQTLPTRITQAREATSLIDKAISQVSPYTAGVGSYLNVIRGTTAKDLQESLTSIKAIVGFDRLQQMRSESAAGSGLGQVSNFENQLLASVHGSLAQEQSPAQLRENLMRVRDVMDRVVNGVTIDGKTVAIQPPPGWKPGDPIPKGYVDQVLSTPVARAGRAEGGAGGNAPPAHPATGATFNRDAAKAAGYTDAEIDAYLKGQRM